MASAWAWESQKDVRPDLSFLLTDREPTPTQAEPAPFDPNAKIDTSGLADEYGGRYSRTPTEDQSGGGFFSGLTGGTSMGLKSTASTTGWTLQGMNDMAGGDPNNVAGAIGQWLGSIGHDDKLKVGDFRNIKNFQDFREYVGEMIGQGIGSMAAVGAAGVAGAVAAGPIGGIAAAGATAFDTNYGEMLQTLHEDPQIAQALKEGKVTRAELAQMATTYGLGMGALDTIGVGKLAKITGVSKFLTKEGGKAAAKEVADTIGKRIAKGALAEGGTEGAQQILEEVGRVRSGGKRDDWESAMAVINSVVGGAIPGAAISSLHFKKREKPAEPPPGLTEMPGPPDVPQLPPPTNPGGAGQSETQPPPGNPPGAKPNEAGGNVPPPPGQPLGATGANTREYPKAPPGTQERVNENFDTLRRRQEDAGTSPDLQVDDDEMTQEEKDRVEGIFDRYRDRPVDRRTAATSTEVAEYDADLKLAATNAISSQQAPTGQQEALPAPPAQLPAPPTEAAPAPPQAPEQPFQRTPMPPPRPDIPFQPLDRGREAPFGRTSGTIPNPLQPPPAATPDRPAGPAPAPTPAPQQVPAAASFQAEPSLTQVTPVPGMVYARHQGRTYAVPLNDWQTAMRLSFAGGRFNPSVLTADREIPQAPAGAEVIEPGLMMRSNFQEEFKRRVARGQPRTEYQHEEGAPRAPRHPEFTPRVKHVTDTGGTRPHTGLIGQGKLEFVPTEEDEGYDQATYERTPKSKPATVAKSFEGLEGLRRQMREAQKRAEAREEPKPGAPLQPKAPAAPARHRGQYTGTQEKQLHAAVTTQADVKAAAMRAVAWHPDKGVQREAVERALTEAREKLPRFRRRMPKELVKRGIKAIERRANEIAEMIDAEELAKQQMAGRAQHQEAMRITEAREKEVGGKRKTRADSPVHGDPIRSSDNLKLILRAEAEVKRLGKDASFFAQQIVRLYEKRKPFAKVRSKKSFSYMEFQKLTDQIEGMRNLWADEEDARMAAFKKETEKQAIPLEEVGTQTTPADDLTEDEMTDIQINAQQARVKARSGSRNEEAKAAVDKHLTPQVFGTWNPRVVGKSIKNAIAEIGADNLPDHFSSANPPWENFLIFAQQELSPAKNTDFDYHDRMVNIALAYTYLGDSKPEQLRAFNKFVRGIRPQEENKLTQAGTVEDMERRAERRAESEVGEDVGPTATVKPTGAEALERDPRDYKADDFQAEQGRLDPRATREEQTDHGKGYERTGHKFHNKDYTYQMRGDERIYKASELLDKTTFDSGRWTDKFMRKIDEAMEYVLRHLVGDVKIYTLPVEAIQRLGARDPSFIDNGANALYVHPSYYEVSLGIRPYILIDKALLEKGRQRDLRHILMHEMVHAATLQSYYQDYMGTGQVLDNLFNRAKQAAQAKGIHTENFDTDPLTAYGWHNAKEFITEGLTNPLFQRMLAGLNMQPGDPDAVRLRDLKPGNFFPTAWAAFRGAVARILGSDNYGTKGMTYLDGLMSAFENMAQDRKAASAAAAQMHEDPNFYRKRNVRMEAGVVQGETTEQPRQTRQQAAEDMFDQPEMFWNSARDAAQAINEAADGSGLFSAVRRKRLRHAINTKGLQRKLDELGWGKSQLYDALTHMLSKEHTTQQLRQAGMKVAAKLQRMLVDKATRKHMDLAQDIMDEGTLANVDFLYDSLHPKNAWFRTGEGFLRHRLAHADLRKRYLALPKEVQDVVREVGTTYGAMQRDAVRESAKAILTAARLDTAFTSIGESVDKVATWVASGGMDRVGTPHATARDNAINTLLTGKVPKKLRDGMSVRRMQGFYIPLKRRGDFVITAMRNYGDKKWLPKGAISISEDRFQFADTAAYESYIQNNQRTKRDRILNVVHDAKKGTYSIRVQNRYMSMHDNLTRGETARQALVDGQQWDDVSVVQHARGGLEKNTTLLPQQVQNILASLAKSGMSPAQLKAAEMAVIQSQVELMQGNRMEHHNRLARQGVFGASTREAVQAMRDYTFGYSNYVSGLRHNPEINTGIQWAENQLKQMQGDDRHMHLDEITREVKRRVAALDGYEHKPWVHNITTMTYASQLLSVVNLFQQVIQSTTTWMELTGTFGPVAATAEMFRVFRDIGLGQITKGTFRDMGTASADVWRSVMGGVGELDIKHAGNIKARLKGADLAAFEAMEKISLIDANAGQEMDVERLGHGRFANTVNAVGSIVQAMTAGVEATNRTVAMLAAVRLHMKAGLSQEEAIKKALNVTEETQGLYSAANAPPIFNTKLGRVALQFKKFAMFTANWLGRQIYHSFGGAKNFLTGQKVTEHQKIQLKTLAWTFLAMGALSGGQGAVPWEIIGLPLMLIQLLMGKKKPSDPVDLTQQMIGSVMRYLGASTDTARKTAEVAMHGLPRLLGMELSDRMGFQNLATFSQPKTFSAADTGAWLWKTAAGPFGSRTADFGQWLGSDKSWTSMPFLPKVIKDLDAAYTGAEEGDFTKYNRRKGDPFGPWETIQRGAGFSTPRSKRLYEPGGAEHMKNEERDVKAERGDLMGKWYKADLLQDADDREEAWADIQKFNEGKPRDQRIDRGDLYKLRQKRKNDLRKEHRKYGEEAYQ